MSRQRLLALTEDQIEALLNAYSIEECQVQKVGERDAQEVLNEAEGRLREALESKEVPRAPYWPHPKATFEDRMRMLGYDDEGNDR